MMLRGGPRWRTRVTQKHANVSIINTDQCSPSGNPVEHEVNGRICPWIFHSRVNPDKNLYCTIEGRVWQATAKQQAEAGQPVDGVKTFLEIQRDAGYGSMGVFGVFEAELHRQQLILPFVEGDQLLQYGSSKGPAYLTEDCTGPHSVELREDSDRSDFTGWPK